MDDVINDNHSYDLRNREYMLNNQQIIVWSIFSKLLTGS